MKQILEYSALNTKIRTMHSALLTQEDLKHLSTCKDVPSVISMLEIFPQYRNTFSKVTKENLHREEVERLLLLNKYDDFSKIYRFSNLTQRKFLELFFMHYEVSLLKKLLRLCLGSMKSSFDFPSLTNFYLKHSHLDFERLLMARNIKEFVGGLSESYYGQKMKESEARNANIFEYESILDQLYFQRIWSEKDKVNHKNDALILTALIGTKIDLLNIVWVYRSKKFYRLSNTQTQKLIVPIYYHLKKNMLDQLIETQTLEEFEQRFSLSYYGKKAKKHSIKFYPNFIYEKEMQDIYLEMKQKNPYSIAELSWYLYQKEKEIEKLISLIESVRYGLDPAQIEHILNNHEGGQFQYD